MSKIILASSSPRRRELLKNAHISFTVIKPKVDEKKASGESPLQYVKRLAVEKASDVARRKRGKTVIAADTIVVVGRRVLEKPRNNAEAKRMLRALSGKKHQVITAYCIMRSKKKKVGAVKTVVEFRKLDDQTIRRYVATGESMDKAGAYAAQGFGMNLIKKISGSYTNVVGLPIAEVLEDLKRV